ncbi:MAG: cyclic peptide export ABC transporter [Deltaproteobacteria bacterium]|nr:cyclic peptide export ABC transporter [Deltaproteobacteria bacterium]
MKFIDFYKKESVVSATPVLVMSSIAGLANAAILFIINSVAMNSSQGDLKFKSLMLFILAFLIFLICKHYSLTHTAIIFEKLLTKVRLRILDKSRNAELKKIEVIGMAQIHTSLTHNINSISETALLGIVSCQYMIMLIICSVYVAWLSMQACIGVAGLLALAIFFFNKKRNQAEEFLTQVGIVQQQVFGKINGLFLGFKELKINRRRSEDYFKDVEKDNQKNENLMTQALLKFVNIMLISEVTFFSMLAGIVFLMPRLGQENASIVPQLVTSILFVMGPIVTIVSILPMLTKANLAIATIYNLEQQLDVSADIKSPDDNIKTDFKEISLENIVFSYKDQYENTLFTLDNINLTVNKGELLFVVGGNGSGKSTVLKILAGLYHPDSGHIRLDGKVLIDQSSYQSFRELFSIIFTDFHLFEKLYGIDLIDTDRIQYYLEKMELDKKTTFKDRQFSNLQLSTGQKKRLAMIVALLFDSEIYIFDELAADQDPEFRKYFYEILLRDLKDKGKTIIVVSHDDQYFHVADRVIKMDYGKFSKGSK